MNYNLDPELALALPTIPSIDFSDLTTGRKMNEPLTAHLERILDRSGVVLETHRARASQYSDTDVDVRVHRPTPELASGPLPVILDIHGGGYCAGSARVNDTRSVELARRLRAVVVSVDYRLAPEHPYPCALEDCYTALTWILENAHELSVDPARVAIVGQSAGGGLAAGLTLLARDRGTESPRFLYLGAPQLDDRMRTESTSKYRDTPFWEGDNLELSWSYYLGDQALEGRIPIYASPGRATVADLHDLPDTYISVAQFDPLRDEGIHFANKLADADIKIELHMFPGTFHSSYVLRDADISERESEEMIRVLAVALDCPEQNSAHT